MKLRERLRHYWEGKPAGESLPAGEPVEEA
jgi:hypothetical protein